nr:hypothetical protein Itr_chr04CG24370 [Ipomoea trifida]
MDQYGYDTKIWTNKPPLSLSRLISFMCGKVFPLCIHIWVYVPMYAIGGWLSAYFGYILVCVYRRTRLWSWWVLSRMM